MVELRYLSNLAFASFQQFVVCFQSFSVLMIKWFPTLLITVNMFTKKNSVLDTSFGFWFPTQITRLTLKHMKENRKQVTVKKRRKEKPLGTRVETLKTKKKHLSREGLWLV